MAFGLSDGQTLTFKVDGGAVQTVTFVTADFVDITNATSTEVAAAINDNSGGLTASVYDTDYVRLTSDSKGKSASIEVTGGTANTVLGYSTSPVTGSGIGDSETLLINDSVIATVTFEFDADDSVTEGDFLRKVTMGWADTTVDMRDALVSAINDADCPLSMSATAYGSYTVHLTHSTQAGSIILTDTVEDTNFVTADTPDNQYVMCLGTDILLPSFEDFSNTDSATAQVSLKKNIQTDGITMLKLQGQFRQPGGLPIHENLPASTQVTRHDRSAGSVDDTTTINCPSAFFTSDHDMREVYFDDDDTTYKIFKGGWNYDSGEYVEDATSAIIFDNDPLGAAGNTYWTGHVVGYFWQVDVFMDVYTIFTYRPSKDDHTGSESFLLPDLTIPVAGFSGVKELEVRLSLKRVDGSW